MLRRRACSAESFEAFSRVVAKESTAESMRLMKKLATLATLPTSRARRPNSSNPAMYACATCSYTLCENNSVTLTLMPTLMSCRNAGIPSGVPGTLIITFSRPTAFHRRLASSSVPSVSRAR